MTGFADDSARPPWVSSAPGLVTSSTDSSEAAAASGCSHAAAAPHDAEQRLRNGAGDALHLRGRWASPGPSVSPAANQHQTLRVRRTEGLPSPALSPSTPPGRALLHASRAEPRVGGLEVARLTNCAVTSDRQ